MSKPQPANGEMGRDERIHMDCATPLLAFVVGYIFQNYERGRAQRASELENLIDLLECNVSNLVASNASNLIVLMHTELFSKHYWYEYR